MKKIIHTIKIFYKYLLSFYEEIGRAGQSAVEYLLLFAGVVLVVIAVSNPNGILTKKLDQSLDTAVNGITTMAEKQCLGPQDDVDGGWAVGAWGTCSYITALGGCRQVRTRTCSNPYPACNGAPCSGPNSETQACFNGVWNQGAWGSCVRIGACGTTAGTQTRSVTCSGDCCDEATKPPIIQSCTTPPYDGTWNAGSWVTCDTSCGIGRQTRVVVCSDPLGCCDPLTKPAVSQACAEGCCDVIEPDITSDAAVIPGTFLSVAIGAKSFLNGNCPSGYVASGGVTPSKVCGTWGIWGPLVGICEPAPCNKEYFNRGISVPLGPAAHGTSDSVDCSSFDTLDPMFLHKGIVKGDCSYGQWINITGTCTPVPPICPEADLDIGSGFTFHFPKTPSGSQVLATCPPGYTGDATSCPPNSYTLDRQPVLTNVYRAAPDRVCFGATWGPTNNPCVPAVCTGGRFPPASDGQIAWEVCPRGYYGPKKARCYGNRWIFLSSRGCRCKTDSYGHCLANRRCLKRDAYNRCLRWSRW